MNYSNRTMAAWIHSQRDTRGFSKFVSPAPPQTGRDKPVVHGDSIGVKIQPDHVDLSSAERPGATTDEAKKRPQIESLPMLNLVDILI